MPPKAKKVIGYYVDGVKIFENVSDASEHTGIPRSTIYGLLSSGNVSQGWSFQYWELDD